MWSSAAAKTVHSDWQVPRESQCVTRFIMLYRVMVTYSRCICARTLLSSLFPWFATLRLYLNLHSRVRHPLSVPVFGLVTTSAPHPAPHTHPSLVSLPQGVAAIVVPNKVYGITDLWNWIFSLHQSSGITVLRPGASGHNWPVSELLFSARALKVGRSRDWCANSSGESRKARQLPCICICTWQLNWFWVRQLFGSDVWISVSLMSTTLTHSSSVCPRNFWLCLI